MSKQSFFEFGYDDATRPVVKDWWLELEDNRGDRARLRRCANLTEVVFEPAYHRLRIDLPMFSEREDIRIAAVAGVLSHVRDHQPGLAFAAQMAQPKAAGGRTPVSGLRFRRLLKCRDHAEVFPALIRIVKLLGRDVDIYSLAHTAFRWDDQLRKQLAYGYYAAAPGDEQ